MPCFDLTKLVITFYTINGGYFLDFDAFFGSQKIKKTVPITIISLKELFEYSKAQKTGLICLKDQKIFYAPVSGVFDFDGHVFNLTKDEYTSKYTLATLEQVRTYTKSYPKVTSCLNSNDDGTYSLEVNTEFTDKDFIEIVREGNDNPGQSRRYVISETISKIWDESTLYPMREVSAEELMQLRLSKKPGVVYKNGDKLFYTTIPDTLNLNSHAVKNISKHACGNHCSMVCRGCPRTSDHTVASQQKLGKSFNAAVVSSWRIEKYPFVTEGIETFNMRASNDAFRVLGCENYYTRTKRNMRPSTDLKLNLASQFWDDFNGTYAEMRHRINQSTKSGSQYM